MVHEPTPDPPRTAVESSEIPGPPGAKVTRRLTTETFSFSPRPITFSLYTDVELDPATGERGRAMWVLGRMLRQRLIEDPRPISETEFSALTSMPNFQSLTGADWQEARSKVALAEKLRTQARDGPPSDEDPEFAEDEPHDLRPPDITAGWKPNAYTTRVDVIVACGTVEAGLSRVVGRVWLAPEGPVVLVADARSSTWGVFGVGGGDADGDDYRYARLPEGLTAWPPCVFCGHAVTVARSSVDECFAELARSGAWRKKLVVRHHPPDEEHSALP